MPHSEPVVEVETSDGHRFELIDIAPRSPQQTLLLLPGMGISARHYIDLARLLAESGTRVLIHEWRGNGSSSRRAGKRHSHGDWGHRELIQCDLGAAMRTVV
ncbi:MAG: serine aminopeptidase domain-containing protein, partial [Wenzhouxiangellaceae bacterium]